MYPTLFLVPACMYPNAVFAPSATSDRFRHRLLWIIGVFDHRHIQRSGAYFSPFARVWELALGALVAVGTPWTLTVPAQIAAVARWLGFGSHSCCGLPFTRRRGGGAHPGGDPVPHLVRARRTGKPRRRDTGGAGDDLRAHRGTPVRQVVRGKHPGQILEVLFRRWDRVLSEACRPRSGVLVDRPLFCRSDFERTRPWDGRQTASMPGGSSLWRLNIPEVPGGPVGLAKEALAACHQPYRIRLAYPRSDCIIESAKPVDDRGPPRWCRPQRGSPRSLAAVAYDDDPRREGALDHRAVAMLLTILVGSTALASTLDPDGGDELHRERFSIMRQALAETGRY